MAAGILMAVKLCGENENGKSEGKLTVIRVKAVPNVIQDMNVS